MLALHCIILLEKNACTLDHCIYIYYQGAHLVASIMGLSRDSETRCQTLAVIKFLGILFFKGDHNIL